jgi:hypothetical protein
MVCNGGEYQLYHIGSPRVVGLTYMVGIIPLNLRSQETDKGVPHARAPTLAGLGRGVARRGRRRAGVVYWCGLPSARG